jgi:hypothetical protein
VEGYLTSDVSDRLDQRANEAFRAIALRSSGVNAAARAYPLLATPGGMFFFGFLPVVLSTLDFACIFTALSDNPVPKSISMDFKMVHYRLLQHIVRFALAAEYPEARRGGSRYRVRSTTWHLKRQIRGGWECTD